mmetsp:Transcript_30530/g.65766  ORF Transcript_30530/g.65766 Transcript_30530/m.65766 type:complete len:314 (+) Transcript_30530:389-1330(+)
MATEEAPPQQPEDGSEGLQEDPNASDAHASEPPVPVDVLHVAELGAAVIIPAVTCATPKIAIVTGVARARGIGRGIVTALLRRPEWCVCGADVADPELAMMSRLDAEHAAERFRYVKADLTKIEECRRVVGSALEVFPNAKCISLLVNNAGISNHVRGGTASGVESEAELLEDFQLVINTNLTSAFFMTRACHPHFVEGANIINISSTRARMSEPGSEAYASAKAGLVGLTHSLAVSYHKQARVNCILPGWIDTETDPESKPTPEEHDFHLTGRAGSPADVAQTCLFLLDQGFMTGAEIVLDGGVTRKMIYPE